MGLPFSSINALPLNLLILAEWEELNQLVISLLLIVLDLQQKRSRKAPFLID